MQNDMSNTASLPFKSKCNIQTTQPSPSAQLFVLGGRSGTLEHLATTVHRALTLQHRYGGLRSDPGDGRVLAKVVAAWVVAGPALIDPGVLQCEARDGQDAHMVGAGRRGDGHPSLAGTVPELLEGVRPVNISIPPLDLWHGITDHVAVQLKGVSCELYL